MKKYLILLLLPLLPACTKSKNGRDALPTIAFSSLSVDQVKAGSGEAVVLEFRFADGDGDLGNSPASGMYDIYTTDSRDTAAYNYFFPFELVQALPPGEAVEGLCQLELSSDLFVLRPERPDGDTVHFECYIRDRAGHISNTITTPDIYILP